MNKVVDSSSNAFTGGWLEEKEHPQMFDCTAVHSGTRDSSIYVLLVLDD